MREEMQELKNILRQQTSSISQPLTSNQIENNTSQPVNQNNH